MSEVQADPRPQAYADVIHPGNGPAYWTGLACINNGCDRPAGTAWSYLWCFRCNVRRIDRITRSLEEIHEQLVQEKVATQQGSEGSQVETVGQR